MVSVSLPGREGHVNTYSRDRRLLREDYNREDR